MYKTWTSDEIVISVDQLPVEHLDPAQTVVLTLSVTNEFLCSLRVVLQADANEGGYISTGTRNYHKIIIKDLGNTVLADLLVKDRQKYSTTWNLQCQVVYLHKEK